MTRIFISYSRVDAKITKELAELLNHSFDYVWYDPKLVGGDDWWAKILAEIESCDHFIYLLSKDSLDSEFCQKEFEVAQTHQKHIIPVCVRARTTIPEAIMKLQVIDMFDEVTVGGLNRVYGSIIHTSAVNNGSFTVNHNKPSLHDEKILEVLWTLINGHYMSQLDHEVFNGLVTADTFRAHIDNYFELRGMPEYQFADRRLQVAFDDFDVVLDDFSTQLMLYSVINKVGSETVMELSIDDYELTLPQIKITEVRSAHLGLGNIIRSVMSDFEFGVTRYGD